MLQLIETTCTHPDAYVEQPCCSGADLIECACGGRDTVVCPEPHCDGIQDWEIPEIMERLQ